MVIIIISVIVMLELAALFNTSCSEVACCRAGGWDPPAQADKTERIFNQVRLLKWV